MRTQEGTQTSVPAGRALSRPEREDACDGVGTITDLGEARALLLEKEATISDLRRAVEHYEAFMRVLGHDLRNPLSAILTTVELANRRARDHVLQNALG